MDSLIFTRRGHAYSKFDNELTVVKVVAKYLYVIEYGLISY